MKEWLVITSIVLPCLAWTFGGVYYGLYWRSALKSEDKDREDKSESWKD